LYVTGERPLNGDQVVIVTEDYAVLSEHPMCAQVLERMVTERKELEILHLFVFNCFYHDVASVNVFVLNHVVATTQLGQ